MSSIIEKQLKKLDMMFLNGKYYEVLEQLNEILEKSEITREEKIRTKILKGKTLHHIAWFGFKVAYGVPAQTILEEAYEESRKINNILLEFDSIYWMFLTLYLLNKHNEMKEFYEKLSNLLKEIKTAFPTEFKHKKARHLIFKAFFTVFKIQLRMEVSTTILEEMIAETQQSLLLFKKLGKEEEINFGYRILGACFFSIGNYDKSMEFWQKSQEINYRWKNKYLIAFCYSRIAAIHGTKGDYDKFIDFRQKSRSLYEELGSKGGIKSLELNLGHYYLIRGEREKALKVYEDCLEFYLGENDKNGISGCYSSIANIIYLHWGKQEKALEYLMKSYRIAVELGDPLAYNSLSLISEIHLIKGELDEALKIREEVLEEVKKYGNRSWIAHYLGLIGEVYWQKGMKKEALEYAKESLKIMEEIGGKRTLIYSHGQIVYYAVESNILELAKTHFGRLKPIVEELKTKPEEQYLKCLEAFILKKSTKINDLIQAEVLLEQLLKEELPYYLLIYTMICLCEVLISQLHLTNDKEILKKLMKYLSKLYDFAESNKAFPLIVETLWLQSQVSLIEMDFEEAKELLSRADQIAKEKGLKRLVKKISSVEDEFNKKTELLANLGEIDSSLSNRMEIIKLNDTMTDIKKERLVDIQQEQHVVSNKLFSIKI